MHHVVTLQEYSPHQKKSLTLTMEWPLGTFKLLNPKSNCLVDVITSTGCMHHAVTFQMLDLDYCLTFLTISWSSCLVYVITPQKLLASYCNVIGMFCTSEFQIKSTLLLPFLDFQSSHKSNCPPCKCDYSSGYFTVSCLKFYREI